MPVRARDLRPAPGECDKPVAPDGFWERLNQEIRLARGTDIPPGSHTADEIAAEWKVSTCTTRRRLNALVAKGKMKSQLHMNQKYYWFD